jgi:hypothetical protein
VQFSSERETRSAIARWRDQIRDLGSDRDIWAAFNYPNPPIMAILLWPVAQLPPVVGALTWFYLKVVMAFLSIWWAIRLVENPARPFPAWGKLLAILLSLRPIMGDLTHGNVNLFILFLVMAALIAFRRAAVMEAEGRLQRGSWQGLAGVLLALAIACKVTPALFLPYFAWKRAWAAVGGCVVGLVLFLWLVPGAILGMDNNARYLGSWVERMILPYVQGAEVWSEHNNQSLPGLLHRLGTHKPSFSTYDENNQYLPVEYHNVLDLDPRIVQWALKGCMAVFAGLVIWRCRTPLGSSEPWRLAAEFSIVFLGMLLFSERTWKHHCVTLLLPFAVLTYYLSACRPGWKMKGYLIGTLALVVLFMTSTSTGVFERLEGAERLADMHDRIGKLAQVYGAYVWAFFLLTAALFVILKQIPRWQPLGPHASTSVTTLASGATGMGLPRRSVSVVSRSIPSK